MKRTLTVVFGLMLIMTAFMACNLEEEFQHIMHTTTGQDIRRGDVSIRTSSEFETYHSAGMIRGDTVIRRSHFLIGIATEKGRIDANTITSLESLGIKLQMRHEDSSIWKDVVFNETTYGKYNTWSGKDVFFKVTNKYDVTKYDIVHVKYR